MKVKCIGTRLSNEQARQIQDRDGAKVDYQLTVGNEYLVLGITMVIPNEPVGGGVQYQILNDYGGCRIVPAGLFEIVDNRVSKYWRARYDEDGALMLWPDEFFSEFFHDDLSEGLAPQVEMFDKIVKEMIQEFG